MLIPKYLENWTQTKRNDKRFAVVEAVCGCGHTEFQVFKNIIVKSAEQIEKEKEIDAFEKRCGWRSIYGGILDDGKYYMYRKNIFGMIVDKVELSGRHSEYTNVIKVRCAKCGKEYTAFDNRIHGYDAFIDTLESERRDADAEIEYDRIKFKGSVSNTAEIRIDVSNELSMDEFLSGIGTPATPEEYSNAFSDITIYGIVKDLNNRKIEIFSEETQ